MAKIVTTQRAGNFLALLGLIGLPLLISYAIYQSRRK